MGIGQAIENILGTLLSPLKGYDDFMLINQAGIKSAPDNIEVSAEGLGPSGSSLSIEHTAFAQDPTKRDLLPRLSWKTSLDVQAQIKEYVLCIEDSDPPIHPSLFHATHGLFYGISATQTSIGHEDVHLVDGNLGDRPGKGAKKPVELSGGFQLGMNARASIYGGARPVLGHGPHRYFFQVIALSEPLDRAKMGVVPTLNEVKQQCVGKVCGKGVWIGTWENKRS